MSVGGKSNKLHRFLSKADETFAGVAQLAEHNVANVVVEGSNPFARSFSLGFPGFGHGFRSKQLVPRHLALPLRISRRACVLGAPFLSPSVLAAAVKRPGKRRRFRGLSFFLEDSKFRKRRRRGGVRVPSCVAAFFRRALRRQSGC